VLDVRGIGRTCRLNGEEKNVYRIFMRNPFLKTVAGKTENKYRDNIKMET
jgi:hypothetical protein